MAEHQDGVVGQHAADRLEAAADEFELLGEALVEDRFRRGQRRRSRPEQGPPFDARLLADRGLHLVDPALMIGALVHLAIRPPPGLAHIPAKTLGEDGKQTANREVSQRVAAGGGQARKTMTGRPRTGHMQG